MKDTTTKERIQVYTTPEEKARYVRLAKAAHFKSVSGFAKKAMETMAKENSTKENLDKRAMNRDVTEVVQKLVSLTNDYRAYAHVASELSDKGIAITKMPPEVQAKYALLPASFEQEMKTIMEKLTELSSKLGE